MENGFISVAELMSRPLKSRRESRQEKFGTAPPVEVRGETLSEPVYWVGRQWAVTEFGLEARDGTYCIAKDRLWENEGRYNWYVHMCNKVWVNHGDFAQALCEARDQFCDLYPGKRGKTNG